MLMLVNMKEALRKLIQAMGKLECIKHPVSYQFLASEEKCGIIGDTKLTSLNTNGVCSNIKG
ncbi:protein of unknown function [Vibrio tapetis subsp. tapetis]|uniref:Uncharacterized protein n=1 Tax=Vibrio tapetis subsp. tapetis TaxID=1671868 RepID=A0A2N8ZI19_9VIBR|nr:protein of unknown function [Vibrio tapetis subsp. tapetis]